MFLRPGNYTPRKSTLVFKLGTRSVSTQVVLGVAFVLGLHYNVRTATLTRCCDKKNGFLFDELF